MLYPTLRSEQNGASALDEEWDMAIVLLVLLSPRSSSERFGAGARPVHPIRVISLLRSNLVASEVKRTSITEPHL